MRGDGRDEPPHTFEPISVDTVSRNSRPVNSFLQNKLIQRGTAEPNGSPGRSKRNGIPLTCIGHRSRRTGPAGLSYTAGSTGPESGRSSSASLPCAGADTSQWATRASDTLDTLPRPVRARRLTAATAAAAIR